MGDFKSFVNLSEWADFGFGRTLRKPEGGTKKVPGYSPMDIIHSSKIISEIMTAQRIGQLQANQKFQNLIEWGTEPGALQIHLTPLGSYKIVVRRLTTDASGANKWVCKGVFPLDEGYHNTKEEIYADEVLKYLGSINEQMLDAPDTGFQNFNKLSLQLFANLRRKYPSYCMFPVGMYKKSDHYHKYVFEFRGHGVEAPTAARAEQFNIDLQFDPSTGMLRCWGYEIDSTTRQHSWRVQPSEWDECFAPTQKTTEIIEAVSKIFMTF